MKKLLLVILAVVVVVSASAQMLMSNFRYGQGYVPGYNLNFFEGTFFPIEFKYEYIDIMDDTIFMSHSINMLTGVHTNRYDSVLINQHKCVKRYNMYGELVDDNYTYLLNTFASSPNTSISISDWLGLGNGCDFFYLKIIDTNFKMYNDYQEITLKFFPYEKTIEYNKQKYKAKVVDVIGENFENKNWDFIFDKYEIQMGFYETVRMPNYDTIYTYVYNQRTGKIDTIITIQQNSQPKYEKLKCLFKTITIDTTNTINFIWDKFILSTLNNGDTVLEEIDDNHYILYGFVGEYTQYNPDSIKIGDTIKLYSINKISAHYKVIPKNYNNINNHADEQGNFCQCYPNPVRNTLTIDNVVDANINIYSITGQLVQSVPSVNGNVQIDMSTMAAGLYIVKIQRGEQNVIKIIQVLK